MKAMKLYHIPPTNNIQDVWPHVDSFIQRSAVYAQGELGASDLYQKVLSGDMQLLVAVADSTLVGAAVVEVQEYPRRRVAFIVALGGRGVTGAEGFGRLREWAWSVGCDSIRGAVRPSMARLLRTRGFEQVYTIMEYAL